MKFILYALLAAQLALSAVVGYQFRALEDARQAGRAQTCEGFTSLDNSFIKLIRQSEASIPSFAYYKEHPADLARVIAADEAAIKVLVPPSYCPVPKK